MGERASSHDIRKLGLVGTSVMLLATGCTLSLEKKLGAPSEEANDPKCQVVVNSYSRIEDGQPLPADNTDRQINITVIFDIDATMEPVELLLKHERASSFTSIYDYRNRRTAVFSPDNTDPNNPNRETITALGLYRDRNYYSVGFGARYDPSFKEGNYDLKVVSESEDARSYCAVTKAFEIIETSTG